MQSIDSDMYEAADMDGASPFQQFRYLSLPMLLGILSVLPAALHLTFNKFDDIFLLTGGNAGTRTLTVNVYEQAFAISTSAPARRWRWSSSRACSPSPGSSSATSAGEGL